MKERGVALITAIVVVAIATVLAVRIGTRASLDLRRTAGLIALDQAWHVALGAEAWAAEVLREDREDSQTDHLAERWAQPIPPLPVDGGTVRGGLEDMQGRFNLNNLLENDGTVNEFAIARLRHIALDNFEMGLFDSATRARGEQDLFVFHVISSGKFRALG